MPQTQVAPDSSASSVDAVVAMLEALRGSGGLHSRPTAATACPPRLRRVVAFMSASRAIAHVEDTLTAQDARPEVTDV